MTYVNNPVTPFRPLPPPATGRHATSKICIVIIDESDLLVLGCSDRSYHLTFNKHPFHTLEAQEKGLCICRLRRYVLYNIHSYSPEHLPLKIYNSTPLRCSIIIYEQYYVPVSCSQNRVIKDGQLVHALLARRNQKRGSTPVATTKKKTAKERHMDLQSSIYLCMYS